MSSRRSLRTQSCRTTSLHDTLVPDGAANCTKKALRVQQPPTSQGDQEQHEGVAVTRVSPCAPRVCPLPTERRPHAGTQVTPHWSLRELAAPGKPPPAGPQTLNVDNFLKDARGPARRQHLRLPQRSPHHQPAAPAPTSSHPLTAPCATGVPSLPNFLDARGSRAGNVSTESCGLIQQVRRLRQELLRTSQVPHGGPILT